MEGYKLLIVDDEYYIRDGLMSFSWKNHGFQAVHSAGDGFEALSYIESNEVHVLLTDICIPKMDGLSLCRLVGENYPQCRLVLISGHKNFEYAKTAIKLGVTDYLLKPIDFDELGRLFDAIREELDQSFENGPNPQETPWALSSIGEAAEYIKRNYQEDLTLAQVAQSVSLSPAYFSTQFKREMSLGFSEYLCQVRIAKAKRLLERMNLKVYEVAELVGFSHAKYFTDTFKKNTGLSPKGYRKTLLTSSGQEE